MFTRCDPIEARAPAMANCVFAVIRQFSGWCLERGILETTPCAGIRAPAADRARDRVLRDDEIKALWQATETITWVFRDPVRLLLLTGARLNEVTCLTWNELDLDAKSWCLPKERSKNKQAHVVPLSTLALDILTAIPRIQSPRNFIFTLNGERPVRSYSDAKRKLDAAMSDSAPWVIHDLRRTCASGMARLGIAPHVVEACLNHKSGTIRGVAAVYNKYSYDAEKRIAMQAWSRHVAAIVSGNAAGNVIELAGVVS
jgi:integrase